MLIVDVEWGSWRQSNKQTKSISSNQLIDLWIDWCRCLFDGCAAGLTALILFHQISFQSIWFHFNGSLPHQWNSNTFNSQSIFIKDWWNWIVGLFPWGRTARQHSQFNQSAHSEELIEMNCWIAEWAAAYNAHFTMFNFMNFTFVSLIPQKKNSIIKHSSIPVINYCYNIFFNSATSIIIELTKSKKKS